jgi:hypothetical protein
VSFRAFRGQLFLSRSLVTARPPKRIFTAMTKLRHDARQDTMWVGKSVPNIFLTLLAVVAGGTLLAYLLH